MRGHPDDESGELFDRPSFLFFGTQAALLMLGLGLWAATSTDLLASSAAEATWDAAIRGPVDRETALAADATEVVMTRSTCEGWCPAYEVRIRSDGEVRFRGDHFVCAFGERGARVDPYEVRHLIQAMRAAGLGRLNANRVLLIDAPVTSILLVSEQGRAGATYQEQDDDALIEMGEHIDAVAGTYRWLPIYKEPYKYCLNDDGTLRRATYIEGSKW